MTIKDIIKTYLDNNNYDGLATHCCGCSKDDLFPCEEVFTDCKPGYIIKCDHHCGKEDPYSFPCFSTDKDAVCPETELQY